MQVVILCGGRGTRLGRASEIRPKPMVKVGQWPILWHIMKSYDSAGHRDFVLCLGYLGEIIKDYFINYHARQSDVRVELGRSRIEILDRHDEDWSVTLADTGQETYTGARLKRVERYVTDDLFMLTYGDGVCDIDLAALEAFHRSHDKIATVTAVHPPARFGELEIAQGRVDRFSEKPQTSAGMINGGFFVFDRRVFDHLPADDDKCTLESDLLESLTAKNELMAYRHDGFWQCMDTVRELDILNELWNGGEAPWRSW